MDIQRQSFLQDESVQHLEDSVAHLFSSRIWGTVVEIVLFCSFPAKLTTQFVEGMHQNEGMNVLVNYILL